MSPGIRGKNGFSCSRVTGGIMSGVSREKPLATPTCFYCCGFVNSGHFTISHFQGAQECQGCSALGLGIGGLQYPALKWLIFLSVHLPAFSLDPQCWELGAPPRGWCLPIVSEGPTTGRTPFWSLQGRSVTGIAQVSRYFPLSSGVHNNSNSDHHQCECLSYIQQNVENKQLGSGSCLCSSAPPFICSWRP